MRKLTGNIRFRCTGFFRRKLVLQVEESREKDIPNDHWQIGRRVYKHWRDADIVDLLELNINSEIKK